MRTLAVRGVTISGWRGVRVFQRGRDGWEDITRDWSWSEDPHQHYEVSQLDGGSYWVPTSTNPPRSWGTTVAVGAADRGAYRPSGVYFWIPAGSRPDRFEPGWRSGSVEDCSPPSRAP